MVFPHRPPHRPPPVRDPLLAVHGDVPVVLLPVRVETRWFDTDHADELELRIRVFPDEIHLAPPLGVTAAERADVATYWQTRTQDGETAATTVAAWTRLVELYGAGRAAWLVRVLAATPTTVPDAEDADLRVAAMPDRWHAIAKGTAVRHVATGGAITRDLPAAPVAGDAASNATQPALGAALAWITDFDVAEAVGMALRMRMPRAEAQRLDELVVIGIRDADPQAGATELGELIARHAGGDGASLLPWGTPTNRATEDAEAVARSRGEPGAWRGGTPAALPIGPVPAGEAARVVSALGIDPLLAQDVVHDGVDRGGIARAMHVSLWPATWGYYLDELANQPPESIARARSLFVEHVRPLGPFPTLRLRAQPYGILPATSLTRWASTSVHGELAAFLARLRDAWLPATTRVPRLVGSTDLDRDLIAILRRQPGAQRAWVRGAVDRDTAAVSAGGDPFHVASQIQDALDKLKRSVEALLLGIPGQLHVTDLVFEDELKRVAIAFVAPSDVPRTGPLAHDYLTALANATPADIVAHHIDGAQPRTLLYLLARHAAQRVIDAASRDPGPIIVRDHRREGVAWHARPGFHIRGSASLNEHKAAMRSLGPVAVGELEAAFAGVLDVASHRVDAWITALASERLGTLRTAQPHATYVGGWAWLEAPRPGPPVDRAQQGFVHAPSVAQARSAGVLRAAYEAHRLDDQGDSLALDLSAERVRDARWLLDGVRAGHPLHKLLGEHIERSLVTHGHGEMIRLLRATPAPSGPVPDVIDGWLYYQEWSKQLPTDAALVDAANELIALVDSVADLLLADGVHHAVAGNFVRAGASLDALERGELTTPDPQFDRSAADGRATRWRVMLGLPERAGWPGPARPRAVAAPRLDGLAAELLGDPRAVRFRLDVERDGETTTVERTLADLDVCALDVVILAADGDDRQLRELAAASVAAQGRVTSITANDAVDHVILQAAALARLFRAASTPTQGDIGSTHISAAADRSTAIKNAVNALSPASGPRLAAAALLGPALGRDPDALRAGVEALKARLGDDPRRAILGDLARSVPVSSATGVTEVAATDSEIAEWLSDLGRVRPALEPLDLLVLVNPRELGASRLRTHDGVELVVFGTVEGSELLAIDSWTEVPPAAEVTTGVAFPFDSPRAQPPQSILIAAAPPDTSAWTLGLLESIVDESVALARVRMIAPEDAHGQLAPALFVADDPDELTPSLDLTAVVVKEVMEA